MKVRVGSMSLTHTTGLALSLTLFLLLPYGFSICSRRLYLVGTPLYCRGVWSLLLTISHGTLSRFTAEVRMHFLQVSLTRRGAFGAQSVNDMPIVQDGPPPGGYPAIRFARRLPNTGPSGFTLFAVTAAVMAYGFYKAC